MNRKQFLTLLAALALLVAAGAGVLLSERSAWQPSDTLIGRKLLTTIKIDDVSEIFIREPGVTLTLTRSPGGWGIREQPAAAADAGRIKSLLLTLIELRIVQTETAAAGAREKLQLLEPKETPEAGAGTVLELKDSSGKILARLLLGSTVMKPGDGLRGPDSGTPAGRRVLIGSEQAVVAIVSDALSQVAAKPGPWLAPEPAQVPQRKAISADKHD
jgi:hypothetical protein